MSTITTDIYRGYKFTVQMSGGGTNYFAGRAAFQKVSGLKTTVEVIEYREGNNPDRAEKLIGMMSFDPITFERGLSTDDAFNSWIKDISGQTLNAASSGQNVPASSLDSEVRRDLTINLHNKAGDIVKQYLVKGAWASEYSIGDFDATSNDVVISTLVVQHHGIVETNLIPA